MTVYRALRNALTAPSRAREGKKAISRQEWAQTPEMPQKSHTANPRGPESGSHAERSHRARRIPRRRATKNGLPMNVYRYREVWRAQIVVCGRHLTVGSAATLSGAIELAITAKQVFHGLSYHEARRIVCSEQAQDSAQSEEHHAGSS